MTTNTKDKIKMLNFQGLSIEENVKITSFVKRLNKLENLVTEKEKQFKFMQFLRDEFDFTERQQFEIYTNTDFNRIGV